jgi:hypothetical protein
LVQWPSLVEILSQIWHDVSKMQSSKQHNFVHTWMPWGSRRCQCVSLYFFSLFSSLLHTTPPSHSFYKFQTFVEAMKVTTHQHISAVVTILAFLNHVLPIFAQPTAPVAPPVVVNPPCAIWYAHTFVLVRCRGGDWTVMDTLARNSGPVLVWCTYHLTVATFFLFPHVIPLYATNTTYDQSIDRSIMTMHTHTHAHTHTPRQQQQQQQRLLVLSAGLSHGQPQWRHSHSPRILSPSAAGLDAGPLCPAGHCRHERSSAARLVQ